MTDDDIEYNEFTPRPAPKVFDWRERHDPTTCDDCQRNDPHPIAVDADGSAIWCDGIEAWNSGEPPTEDELDDIGRVATRMVAKTTDQGTAASETALCDLHDTPTNRGTFGAAADTDVTGPWVDATDNEALECQVCGARTEGNS